MVNSLFFVSLSEDRNITDPLEVMKLFASLLLSIIINPLRKDSPQQIQFQRLVELIEKRFGGFRALQVGNIKDFLQKSTFYQLKHDCNTVAQTKVGFEITAKWMYRVNTPPSLREKHCETSSVNPSVKTPVSSFDGCSKDRAEHTRTAFDDVRVPPLDVEDSATVGLDAGQYLNKSMADLSQRVDELDSSYTYILVSSKLASSDLLDSVASIPWLQVFDFDSGSRQDGLLSRVEVKLQEQRNFTISLLAEPPKIISEKATHWLFVKGLQEKPNTVFSGSSSSWRKNSKSHLKQHCMALSSFCCFHKPAIVFILWYDDDPENMRCLEWLLIKLDEAFSEEAETFLSSVIICTSATPECNNDLHQLVNMFNWHSSVFKISVESFCNVLATRNTAKHSRQDKPYLPKLCEDDTVKQVEITKKNLSWLDDYIEVLVSGIEKNKERMGIAGEEFVKGGTLAWDEISMGNIAVERSIQQEIYDYIKHEIIDTCMSNIIRIFHAPGGGGTTFGRQLLWKLRRDAACVVVRPTAALPISGLVERIQFLHSVTLLPVVILVDGISDYEVELLYKSTYAVVILHIQRYNKEIKESTYQRGSCCYLSGNVTKRESEELATVFSNFAPDSKAALHQLHMDVVSENPRKVFEFGLAAFNHEFKGVRKYVKGYMEPRSAELQNWQKVVAYLSLLMCYGQCGIPGHVFQRLIRTSYNPMIKPESLHSGGQFVINECGYWKINYNAVAKEILEFVLSLHGGNSALTERLSMQARDKLHLLVTEFVKYVGEAVGNNVPDRISYPLSQMVLKRDSYGDAEVADDPSKKKKFSRLLDDIPGEENRIEVLKQFTRVFPKHVELRAHLGRLYSMHNKFKDAEKSFEFALELRTKERSEVVSEKTDNVRGRLHHMFGFSYLHRIKYDCDQGDTPQALKTARKAVHQFYQGRNYAVHNRSYGYIGEVRARLLMVQLFLKYHHIAEAFNEKLKKHQELAEFVQESHAVCDQLLVECQQYTAPSDLRRISDYFTCVSNFNDYFQGLSPELPALASPCPNIRITRSKIASIKMKYKPRNKKEIKDMDGISDKRDIVEIVELLDATLRDVFSNDYRYVSISVEMLQWLDAIRHPLMPDRYSLIDVLHFVQQWESRNEFGLATFYLYVINFLMAVCASGALQRQSYVDKASELGKKLRMISHQNPIHQRGRESFASHSDFTIRKLLPRRSVGIWDKYKKEWSNEEAAKCLQVCTGTVIKSDLPLIGFISLDVADPIPNRTIEVYFVPKRHSLHGRRFSERCTRVEFYIVFNTHNGAEAEAVRVMQRKQCPTCKMSTEVITLNQRSGAKCSRCSGHYM